MLAEIDQFVNCGRRRNPNAQELSPEGEDTALLESNRSAQVRPSIGQRVALAVLCSLRLCPIDGLKSDKLFWLFTSFKELRKTPGVNARATRIMPGKPGRCWQAESVFHSDSSRSIYLSLVDTENLAQPDGPLQRA